MAVGKSGARAERDRLRISIGGVLITQDGQRLPDYDETPVAAHMAGDDIACLLISAWVRPAQKCGPVI